MNVFRTRHFARLPAAGHALVMHRVAGLAFITSLLVSMQAHANTDSPTIRLFPTTVVEDLRQTSAVAKEMETGLQEVIGRLDQQQQLYLESKCDGAEDDPGCQRLAKQLGATRNVFRTRHFARLPAAGHALVMHRVAGLAFITSLLVSMQAHANTDSPTIRLFPTTVVEDLRQTSAVAKEMETGLQEVGLPPVTDLPYSTL